jgi:hypothetical protein
MFGFLAAVPCECAISSLDFSSPYSLPGNYHTLPQTCADETIVQNAHVRSFSSVMPSVAYGGLHID